MLDKCVYSNTFTGNELNGLNAYWTQIILYSNKETCSINNTS